MQQLDHHVLLARQPIYNRELTLHGFELLFRSPKPINAMDVGEDAATQAEQVMNNLGEVLKAAGSDFSKVIKCSIFLDSMDDFGVVNEVYGAYFEVDPPARETVAVQTLPKHQSDIKQPSPRAVPRACHSDHFTSDANLALAQNSRWSAPAFQMVAKKLFEHSKLVARLIV